MEGLNRKVVNMVITGESKVFNKKVTLTSNFMVSFKSTKTQRRKITEGLSAD